jgi:Tfp pilus assembly protein PilN
MAAKMVKVNLLQDQQGSGEVKRVVRKASGVTQQVVMLVVAIFALVVVVALDYFQANLDSKRVQGELSVQQARSEELKRLTAKREELAKQKQAVDDRIAVIKQLRQQQSGPVTLLSQLNSRIPDSGLYLFNIKQTDRGIAMVGRAENEDTVQRFVKNLEGSEGVFNAPEVTVVLPARFNSKDKLKAHITEMMSELGVDSVNIETLSAIAEDTRENKPVLFALRCSFVKPGATQTTAQNSGPTTPGAKGAVAAVR